MTAHVSEGLSLRSYFSVLMRWKWLIIAVTLVAAAGGFAYVHTRVPMYASTANLLYSQQVSIQSLSGIQYFDATQQQADVGSVPAVISSSAVGEGAAKLLTQKDQTVGYSVGANLTTDTTTSNYSNVVGILADSTNPHVAADVANAYAQAFISWRQQNARAQVKQQINAVQTRMSSYTTPGAKLTSSYLDLVAKLQDLQLLEASVTGDFQLISPASAPSVPFSPRKTRDLALAGILGLVLGVVIAFVIEQLDTRVRDEEQLADALGLTVLGHVPPVKRAGGDVGVLQMLVNPFGPSAEAYRVLRSNLDFMGVDGDVRSLVVSSAIQGEGKSVTACNLAISMAMAGKSVVLVDADLRRPRLHTYLGLANGVGLSSVVARLVDLEGALVSVPLDSLARSNGISFAPTVRVHEPIVTASATGRGRVEVTDGAGWTRPLEGQVLRVLPSGPLPPNPGEMVASQRLREIIAILEDEADLVIIDSPAILPVGDTAAIAANSDALLFLSNPSQLKRPMLIQARALIAQLPCRKLGLVIIASKRRQAYYGHYHHDAAHEPQPAGARV